MSDKDAIIGWNDTCSYCGRSVLGFKKYEGTYDQLKIIHFDGSEEVLETCQICGERNVRFGHKLVQKK